MAWRTSPRCLVCVAAESFLTFSLFQPREARQRRFVGFDPRRAKHNDGVGNALSLQLHQGMEIFRQDAQGPRGGTFEKPVIFMRRFGGVLGLQLELSCGHGFFSPKDANNHCRNRGRLRQRLPARVRRIEYTAESWAFSIRVTK